MNTPRILLVSVALLSACATVARPPALGTVTYSRSKTFQEIRPDRFDIYPGEIRDQRGPFQAKLGADGCVDGILLKQPLCPAKDPASPSETGARLERWSSALEDLTLEVSPDGKTLRLDRSRGGWLHADLELKGDGVQWQEVRRNPILLAVAYAHLDPGGGQLFAR